jgi:hypothetical protein
MTIEIVGIDVKRNFETMRSMSGEMFVAISSQSTTLSANGISEELYDAINSNPAVLSTLQGLERTEYQRKIHELEETVKSLRESERDLTARLDTIRKCLGCDQEDDEWLDDYDC